MSAQGGFTHLQLVGEFSNILLAANSLNPGGQVTFFAGQAHLAEQPLHHGVALRVNERIVERVVATRDLQETDGLLVRFLAQPLDAFDFLASFEGAFLVPVSDNRAGLPFADSGHIAEEGGAGGVDVHSHVVDGTFHDVIQRLSQLFLVDVVLVQADADGLGVDLDQLGQGVLQAPADRDGTAHADIQLRELAAGQVAG